jgi:hypothetical protein
MMEFLEFWRKMNNLKLSIYLMKNIDVDLNNNIIE